MITIGIDPGATGALALRVNGTLKDVKDMPTIQRKVGKTLRSLTSPGLIVSLLREWTGSNSAQIMMEQVGPSPRDGKVGAFTFGRGVGQIEAAAAALAVPVTFVLPQVWKRAMSCPTDKSSARARACELYPAWADSFARVRDDGRAEAAMIAEYGERALRLMME